MEVPTNSDLEIQPQMGDVVTIEHEIQSRRDLPENLRISRVRKDLSWEDVLFDYEREGEGMSRLTFILAFGYFWFASLRCSLIRFLSVPFFSVWFG
jgi:hypothetical protein